MSKGSSSALGISGLDIRSIALFRILVGFNVIYNILQYRLFNISAFYSEEGIVPRSLIETNYGSPFSLLNYIDSEFLVGMYFVICLLLALMYMLGIKSRWVGIALFVLFGSIINANPLISHGVEFLIEVSLFWGIFLPLDACFSLLPERSKGQKVHIKGLVTYGIILQIALVYLTSFLTKTGDLWQSGMVIYSLTDDRTHAVILADWLSDKPGFCSFLSYFALLLELCLPFLILSPIYNRASRLLAAIGIVGLHVGLALVLFVGPFHLITLVFSAVLLPGFVWKKLNISADTNFPLGFLQSKTTKAAPVKGRKAKEKQAEPAYPIGEYLWKTVIIVMLFVVFQKNLQKWKKESYLSNALSNMGPISELADMNPTKATPFTGLLQQPWWLFAPNPHKDMGTIVLLGRTDTNETLDLLGNRILTIESDPMTQEPKFDKKIVNHFSSSRFVLSFYARRYINNFPPELFQRWTNFEYQRWRKDNPEQKLLELRMYYYSNATKLERGKIIRKKDLALMHTMPIVE